MNPIVTIQLQKAIPSILAIVAVFVAFTLLHGLWAVRKGWTPEARRKFIQNTLVALIQGLLILAVQILGAPILLYAGLAGVLVWIVLFPIGLVRTLRNPTVVRNDEAEHE